MTNLLHYGRIQSTNISLERGMMTFPKSLPTRVWICPGCASRFGERWLLSRHLREVHRLRKNKADDVAVACEYWLNPSYIKREAAIMQINPDDFEADYR